MECYYCPEAVCLSSRRCTDSPKLNYACPDTDQCADPGVRAWLQCSSSRPGVKDSRGAAKEGTFKLAFVAYRMRGGILDKELAEEE